MKSLSSRLLSLLAGPLIAIISTNGEDKSATTNAFQLPPKKAIHSFSQSSYNEQRTVYDTNKPTRLHGIAGGWVYVKNIAPETRAFMKREGKYEELGLWRVIRTNVSVYILPIESMPVNTLFDISLFDKNTNRFDLRTYKICNGQRKYAAEVWE